MSKEKKKRKFESALTLAIFRGMGEMAMRRRRFCEEVVQPSESGKVLELPSKEGKPNRRNPYPPKC